MALNAKEYRLIVESSPNMIWRSNLTKECDYFNKRWLEFTGRTIEMELGYGWAEGVHPDDYDRCVSIYVDSFEKQLAFEMDYRLKRYDGEYRWINDRGVPAYDDNGHFTGYIGSCMDITEKVEGSRLKTMAQTDSLCQTYNRQYSHILLTQAFQHSIESGQPLTILMMDLDEFKHVNDCYGHAAGDDVLQRTATVAKQVLRQTDIIGRYGGDEFMIGLINTDLQSGVKLAERICDSISKNFITIRNGKQISVTVSIGVQTLEKETSIDALIDLADHRLYQAKSKGKAQVVS